MIQQDMSDLYKQEIQISNSILLNNKYISHQSIHITNFKLNLIN